MSTQQAKYQKATKVNYYHDGKLYYGTVSSYRWRKNPKGDGLFVYTLHALHGGSEFHVVNEDRIFNAYQLGLKLTELESI